jgi:hypothetical protein
MPFSCEFSSAFSDAFAICQAAQALDVPRQTYGGKGAMLMRPEYDPIATNRPNADGLIYLREIDVSVRRTALNALGRCHDCRKRKELVHA